MMAQINVVVDWPQLLIIIGIIVVVSALIVVNRGTID